MASARISSTNVCAPATRMPDSTSSAPIPRRAAHWVQSVTRPVASTASSRSASGAECGSSTSRRPAGQRVPGRLARQPQGHLGARAGRGRGDGQALGAALGSVGAGGELHHQPARRHRVVLYRPEQRAEPLDGVVGRGPRAGRQRPEVEVAVDHPVVAPGVDLDAGRGQRGGVRLALVAQRVELGGDDDGGRQAGQPAVDRRHQRVADVGRRADVVVAEPGHVLGGEEVALRVLDPGRVVPVRVHVGRRVDEQLRRQPRTLVPADLGENGTDVAPGAVARDRDPVRVPTELADVPLHPADGLVGVADRGRPRRLRREPVVDAHHDGVRAGADRPALVVVGVDVADDEPAAVHEQHARQRAVPVRPVDARGDVAVRRRDHGVLGLLDPDDVLGPAHLDGHEPERLPGLLRRSLAHRRSVQRGERVQHGLDVGIERHPLTVHTAAVDFTTRGGGAGASIIDCGSGSAASWTRRLAQAGGPGAPDRGPVERPLLGDR